MGGGTGRHGRQSGVFSNAVMLLPVETVALTMVRDVVWPFLLGMVLVVFMETPLPESRPRRIAA